ncbi:MAG TPA: DUF305 domain-containing protein [Casimicrobiaceae bacterium]|jgi:uncharacterized protein (DUF305 family)|nr:DUF305 domain-containing protein [Casimicrobiaceae bacterium]
MEIIMKHERFLADTCRAICALGAFVFIAVTSAALAQTPASPADKSAPKGPPTPAATQPSSMDKKDAMTGMPGMAAGGDMRSSMMGMMKSMDSMKMTGDADRDFATMMKIHHQGAIDMAQMELKSGKDAKMRAMAKRIIEAQQKEIKEFDRWLAKRK